MQDNLKIQLEIREYFRQFKSIYFYNLVLSITMLEYAILAQIERNPHKLLKLKMLCLCII